MQDDTQSLLNRIGQPGFSYRDFSRAEDADLSARWPLLARIAAHPAMRATPLASGRAQDRRSEPRTAVHGADTARQGGFLKLYAADGDRPEAKPGLDVRSLLGRLSEDLR